MKNSLNDIITALATPAGVGAISVIRVSGKNSIAEVDLIFKGKSKLITAKPNTIHYGNILSKENKILDDVIVSVFKNPYSYTGEDSIEISTHGNPLVTQNILNRLLELNIRLAEPGEFTRRAFLNGKIDLSQAEAVADIISARTETSLRGARNQLDGILSSKIEELKSSLIEVSSLLELELDFAEEDLEFIENKEVIDKTNQIIAEINRLIKTYEFGKVIRDGVNVALVGKPNVGKSSLLNYIVKEARAIVSEIPGTTRDVIIEEVSINGVLYKFFDTAGIRSTQDTIEKEGVLRSREAVKNSDVVVFLSDINQGIDTELFNELCSLTNNDRIISVLNKVDLGDIDSDQIDIRISATKGIGIEEFFNKLNEKVFHGETYSEATAIVTNIRHLKSLEAANDHLLESLNALTNNMSNEFISADIRNSIQSLGEIIGEVTSEDILNNIFAKFCIGK